MIIGLEKEFPYSQDLEEINLFYEEFNKRFKSIVDMRGLAKMHFKYENIHPYPDENRHTERLFINYFLVLNKQAPIVIPFENRSQYLKIMQDTDVDTLCVMFQELQEKEILCIQYFLDMDKEYI